ncbi:MAG: SRPBCC domain-containing protein [Leptospiraceae bacterium]|nr:SRPBCC domain-containing protein [Leptospiraceae bacterium]
MQDKVHIRFSLPATAKQVYDAWLDSAQHTAMTGKKAVMSREVGGSFSVWDGYVEGKNLLLIENRKIVQSWRAKEFHDEDPDSVVAIQLSEKFGVTEVEIEHSDLPPGKAAEYQEGWFEYYVDPMQRYFAKINGKKAESQKRVTRNSGKPHASAGRVVRKAKNTKKATSRKTTKRR